MAKQLICLSDRNEDLEFAAKVANKIALPFHRATSVEDMVSLFRQSPEHYLFIDADHPKHGEAVLRIPKGIHHHQVYSFADEKIFALAQHNYSLNVGTYCIRIYDQFALDSISYAIQTLSRPVPLEFPAKATLHLTRSGEKGTTLAGLEKLLLSKGVNQRCMTSIIQAVDELLMNAIFDAPADEKGRTYRKTRDRSDDFQLAGREEIKVKVNLRPEFIQVAVEDHFGSLSTAAVLKLVRKDYTKNTYDVIAETKSAGLGLHAMVKNGFSLSMNVDPGKLTQTVLTFPIYKSFKTMRNSFHSFGINVMETKKAENILE
jgi:hypothetical protein